MVSAYKLLSQRTLPVASQVMKDWVINRSIMEEDFSPEEGDANSPVASTSPISALAVITVEPSTGRVMGSRWSIGGEMSQFKFRANRVLPDIEDDSVSFYVKLPKLQLFEFRANGQCRNYSQWLDWNKVFTHGSIAYKSKNGKINSTDREAIIANCPSAANGLLFRLVVCPKNLGNIVLAVNIIPGTLDQLHQRCRDQGFETTYVHHPVYKPTMRNNVNSMTIPYAKIEKPIQKFCFGHIPVIEIITGEDEERALPSSSALREELYSLHR